MKVRNLLAFLALAAFAVIAMGCPTEPPEPVESTAKNLLTFVFEASKNPGVLTADVTLNWTVDETAWTTGTLPAGTNITALIPTFTLSPKASAKIDGTAVVSGVSAIDFSAGAKTLVVTAENGSTKSYTLTVPAAELGISVFTVHSGTLPEAPLTVNANGTITGEIPFSYDLANLVATFSHNGSEGTANAVAFGASPVTTGIIDFSNSVATPVPFVVTNTVLGTVVGTENYDVTITKASAASTLADLASVTFQVGTTDYPASVDTGAKTVTVTLPYSANRAAVEINFVMDHVLGKLCSGGSWNAGNILTSGTSTLDMSATTNNVWTGSVTTRAEDDATSNTYTITATFEDPAAAIVAFDSDSLNDNLFWVDVKILDKSKVTGTMRLVATGQYHNVLIANFATLAFWADVVDGDVIRVWDWYSLKTDDVTKADNDPTRWDIKNPEVVNHYNMGKTYGALYIDNDTVIQNIVVYSIGANSSWTLNASCQPALDAARDANLWPIAAGTATIIDRLDAYNPAAYTAGCYYQLNGVDYGLSAADWTRATDQEYWTLGSISATPQVAAGTGGTINFSVTPTYTGTGTHGMTSVALDVSLLLGQTANTTNVAMTDSGSGPWTLDYSCPTTVTSGPKTLRFRTETVVNGVTLLDTATTTSYTVLPTRDVTIDSFTTDTPIVIYGVETPIVLTALVSLASGTDTDITAVTADLTGLGGSATAAFTYGGIVGQQETWTCNYTVPNTATAQINNIPLSVVYNGPGSPESTSCTVTVSSDPIIQISSFSTSPTCIGRGTAGQMLTLDAVVIPLNSATISSVVADLGQIQSGQTKSLTNTGGNNWSDATYEIPDTTPPGVYTITLTVTDNVSGGTTTTYTKTAKFAVGYSYTVGSPYTIGFESLYDTDNTTTITLPWTGTGSLTSRDLCHRDSSAAAVIWTWAPGTSNTGYINTTPKVTGTYGAGFNQVGQMMTSKYPFINPTSLSFSGRSSTAPGNFTIVVQYSSDGTTWTTPASGTFASGTWTTTATTKTTTFNLTGAYYIRIYMSARTGHSFYFDDISMY